MLNQGSCVIVDITSIQRVMPLPDATIAYAAAKAALANYIQGLSKEVSSNGVRVVQVSPGWVETEAAVDLVNTLAANQGTDYEGARKALMDSLGGTQPTEAAELIAFLASPRAASIKAQNTSSTAARYPSCNIVALPPERVPGSSDVVRVGPLRASGALPQEQLWSTTARSAS
jgi:NAD(P)-dependent dehydrogenase (short-subunit alcohol dehydrogenase family)